MLKPCAPQGMPQQQGFGQPPQQQQPAQSTNPFDAFG